MPAEKQTGSVALYQKEFRKLPVMKRG